MPSSGSGVPWHCFSSSPERLTCMTALRYEHLSASQMLVLKKLALLHLTALMERFSPPYRSGWGWAVPKFIKRMRAPDYKGASLFSHACRCKCPVRIEASKTASKYLTEYGEWNILFVKFTIVQLMLCHLRHSKTTLLHHAKSVLILGNILFCRQTGVWCSSKRVGAAYRTGSASLHPRSHGISLPERAGSHRVVSKVRGAVTHPEAPLAARVFDQSPVL